MRKLSFVIFLSFLSVFAQSPHGKNFAIDCAKCHKSDEWKISGTPDFDHNTTHFKLSGRHKQVNCKQCHSTLQFADARTECSSCHRDVHKGSVSAECSRCHTTDNWLIPQSNKLHQSGRFPLQGMHAQADCKACHGEFATLNFTVLGTACYDCHSDNFQGAKNPDHVKAGFSKECQSCHLVSASAWRAQAFRHEQFPLTGKHQLDNCYSCHNKTTFTGLSAQCYSCHQSNFAATTNPNHVAQQFSTQCQTCHTTTGWKPALFDHNKTSFPLTGTHISTNCSQCHITAGVTPSKDCYTCHSTNYNQTTNPNHAASGISKTCNTCHTTTAWKPASFDHNITAFPLTGAHITASCEKCHTTPGIKPSQDCYSCHSVKYNQTTNPGHIAAGFGQNCKQCHTTTAWTPASFDHDGPFFPINSGKHKGKWNVCADCHTNLNNYKLFSCVNCHEHDKTKMDSEHRSVGGYVYQSTACFNCHPKGTENGAFNHQTSQFPLTGSHVSTTCEKCHTTGYTTAPPVDCKSCHLTQANPVTNPNHGLPGFSAVCSDCHNTNDFKQTTFNHQIAGQYPLLGKHAAVTCNNCHKTQYTNTPKVCKDCHLTDYQSSASVNHQLANFTQPCSECHSESSWKPAQYTHTTNFTLTGKHMQTACKDCHESQYTNTTKECKGCHISNYNQTTNPNHAAAAYSQQCQDCHITADWKQTNLNHDAKFPIYSGKHKNTWQLCNNCHINNRLTEYSCVNCHEHGVAATNNQHLTVSGYIYSSTECKACHPTGVKTASFNHAQSAFPLTGAHIAAQCKDCHVTGYTQKPTTDCKTCHQSDLIPVTNPNHSLGNFSQTCTNCHTTTKWKPSTFNHTTGTQFALQGAHVTASCNSCHAVQYANTTKICKDCHSDDFQQAANPNHTRAGFTQPCEQCHTAAAWTPSSYNHSTTGYALVGKHITTACNKCHATQFANTTTDCYTCHTATYNNTTTPQHAASNIQTTCKTCHTPNNWTTTLQYTQHDASLFPIYSGEHRNKWTKCTDCHRVATNYNTFSCIDCHEHNQTSMNNEHRNVVGYIYQSSQCFHCHPRGSSANAFNHATGTFPLNGAHLAVSCNSCHASGYSGTPTACYSCHQTDFTNAQNPNHTNAGLAQTCTNCHNTTAWTPSSFTHATTTFPLTGSHIGVACASCHIGSTTGTGTQCKNCHTTKFQNTTNPSHTVLNLSLDCPTCHTTTGTWKPATFPVHASYWAFQGAHVAIKDNCVQCHNGNYTSTPKTCYACHQAKYTSTVSPPHVRYNISQVCSTCHTQTAWTPATFNHSFYPISNDHRNVTCKQCHSLSGYAPQCLTCHQNDYRRGHNSSGHPNCYQCHGTSNFDDKSNKKKLDEIK